MSSRLKLGNSRIQSGFHYRNVILLAEYRPHKRQGWTKLRNLNSDRHSLCKHTLFMGYIFYIPLNFRYHKFKDIRSYYFHKREVTNYTHSLSYDKLGKKNFDLEYIHHKI